MTSEEERQKRVDDFYRQRRVVQLNGKIERKTVEEAIERLLELEALSSEPVTLLINNNGGRIFEAFKLCDVIRHVLSVKVRAVVVGECNSAATLVLLHCSERHCTPRARFLVHSPTNEVSFRLDDTFKMQIQEYLATALKLKNKFVRVYMDTLGLTRKEVNVLLRRGDQQHDCFLSAEEAKKLHLVQKIVTTKLDVFVSPID